MGAARACALTIVSCSLFGCWSVSIGPTAGRTLWSDGNTSAGLRSGIKSPVLGSNSVAVGVEGELRAPRGEVDEWRTSIVLGYSSLPRPWEGRWGFEAATLVGGGQIQLRDETPGAFHLGVSLGLALRITGHIPPLLA